MDIEKLKAIATAATGGDWVIDGEVINEHGHLLQIYVGKAGAGRVGAVFANCTVTDEKCRANAEFMAEARPAVVLELIAEIERLGRNNEMWKGQVERQAKALSEQRGLLQRRHEAHRTTWTQQEQMAVVLRAAHDWIDRTSFHGTDARALLEQISAAIRAGLETTPTYQTRAGESVMGIAMRELGDESRWQEIVKLNADRFPDMGPHDYYPIATTLKMPARRFQQ